MTAITVPPAVATATRAANAALAQATRVEKEVSTAQAAVGAATKKVDAAAGDVKQLEAKLAELKKDPAKNEAAITQAQTALGLASDALQRARSALAGANANAAAAVEKAKAAQSKALELEKKADVAALAHNVPQPFPGALDQVDLTDAGSMKPADHERLLGGRSHVGAGQATDRDVKFIAAATKANPENGMVALADNLKSGSPEANKALLAASGPTVALLMKRISMEPPDAQAMRMAEKLLSAASNTDPATRDALMAKLLQAGGGRLSSNVMHAFSEVLPQGDGFRAASSLVKQLPSGSPIADRIKNLEASAIGKLRQEFVDAREVTSKLEGELGRLAVGFGPMLTGPQLEKAIEGFRAEHATELAATERAAAKLSQAFEVEGQLSAGGNKTEQARLNVVSPGQQQLTAQLHALGGEFEHWRRTGAGGNHLEKAVQEEIDNGKPSWLSSGTQYLKDTKKGAESLARGVSAAIAARAASGNLTKLADAAAVLKHHADALGIAPDRVKDLTAAIMGQNEKGGIERMKKAIERVEGGKFGVSVAGVNAIKALGVGVGIFAAANGFGDWGNLKPADRLKVLVDATKTGAEGAALTATLMGRASVATALSRVGGGISVITGGLDTLKGAAQLIDGNWRDGVGNVAVGAGTMVLGLATATTAIPGWGTAVGAALVAGGLVWKHLLGNDPMADAEKAAEKGANAFLKAAGLPGTVVNTFDDLYQADHRNVGFLLDAVAKHMGMTAPQLFQKLLDGSKTNPDLLEDFVMMAKNVPIDGKFQFAKEPRPGDTWDHSKVQGDITYQDGFGLSTAYSGPKSLATAKEWLEDHGIK